jgi:hypothetical protein
LPRPTSEYVDSRRDAEELSQTTGEKEGGRMTVRGEEWAEIEVPLWILLLP